MKLKNKCQIGSTVFNVGVDYKTVIARAEREYQHNKKLKLLLRKIECKGVGDNNGFFEI